jgi:predicted CXXCH cytochrome family protein
MNPIRLRPGLSLALLLLGAFLLAAAAPAAESCAAAGCHATLVAGKSVHAATESCDACHEAVVTPHPQAGKATFKLTQSEPALCADCHDAFGKKGHVHEPVAQGSCSTCHDPHASQQPKLLLAAQGSLCGDCHSDALDGKHLHGPVSSGECTSCHTPHESDAKALLVKTGDALCFDCHSDIQDDLRGKSTVHAALDDGCTSCHDPHGAAQPKLLAEAGGALCLRCHDDVGAAAANAAVPHAALEDERGCAGCHAPHASNQAKLLLAPEKETCLACHGEVIDRGMAVLHQPIADGKCTPCHQPHGGANAKLLVKAFPTRPYVAYTGEEYGLCFECHNRELLQYADTSFATQFRDGERNLHFLHVNDPQKGRSCVFCHGVHGSAGAKLVEEGVKFGQWSLPIKFVKTETGGGCAPGCHRPAYYDREVAGRKPPAKSAGGG